MTSLFDETAINGMTMKNRIVRSATWEGMCESDGRPTERLVDYYAELARGGAGLLISGYTFVRPDGKQLPGKMGIHTDGFEGEMQALTEAVHEEGGKICIQLVHAGGQTDTSIAGRRPLAPSEVEVEQFPEIPQEMSLDDISRVLDAFGEAAARAKSYGFDAIQLHAAHGYLINQFLSPLTNRRTDEYGGSIEARCRFFLEAYGAVRSAVGSGYPVMIKLNGSDFLEGGLSMEDALDAAVSIDLAGIDAIEVSGGTSASGDMNPARTKINKPEKEAYNLDLARRISGSVSCPVIVVGGFRSYEVADDVVSSKGVGYISMSRPFIREPGLPLRWQLGETSPAKCISCNKCFQPGIEEGGVYCVVDKEEKR